MTAPYDRDRPDQRDFPFPRDHPDRPGGPGLPGRSGQTWAQRRQEKLGEQFARAQRGDHLIPTWVLVVLNVVIIVGCVLGLLLT